MVARTCAVLNCPGNYSKLYKFPKDRKHDEKRISKWLSAAGNTNLLHLPEKKLLEKAICNLHFEAKYFFRRGVSRSAVPTLNLPDPIEVPRDHYTRVESEGCKTDDSNENRAIDESSTSEKPIKIPLDCDNNDGSNEIRVPLTDVASTNKNVQMYRNNGEKRKGWSENAVKNKAPAKIQITSEQLLRESKERDLEILPPLSI